MDLKLANMNRVYESMVKDHFQRNEQMLLVSGARQVGKTTVGKAIGESERFHYLNWDLQEDRLAILGGATELVRELGKGTPSDNCIRRAS